MTIFCSFTRSKKKLKFKLNVLIGLFQKKIIPNVEDINKLIPLDFKSILQ